MPTKYRTSLVGLLLFLIPTTGYATDRRWDAEGVVTIRNAQPCFSYPQDSVIRSDKSYALSSLYVTEIDPSEPPSRWDIRLKNFNKKSTVEPNSPETCIIYNVLPSGMKEMKPAKPLLLNTPYYMEMDVDASVRGSRTFRTEFCLSRNAKGKTILVGIKWDDSGPRCLKPGESPKRSLWQRLFGK
jgi:hypothetical protein